MERNKNRDYSLLRELGLSKTAVSCYQSLASGGGGKVSMVANRLNLPRTSLYKVLENMHQQGFIHKTKVPGASASYAAKPINKAMDSYLKHLRQLVNPLLGGYEDFAAKFAKGQHLD